jgi:hypothetical protein
LNLRGVQLNLRRPKPLKMTLTFESCTAPHSIPALACSWLQRTMVAFGGGAVCG